ncbi:MAG: hypothetical protein N3J91_06885 [Verrucomicrobiae bacterium]|nr:hypothetical protein [Verrucomicrobiae bacterium]
MPRIHRVFLLALLLFTATLAAQTPGWLCFQGRVLVEGQPLQGEGWFKFALVAGMGAGRVWWHHDGTEAAQEQPATPLRLGVSNGLFAVGLGDTTLAGMAPLPAAWEEMSEVRVRVWFSDGRHGWAQLAPDLRLGAVPYALQAGRVPPQSIGWEHFSPALQTRLGGSNAPAGLVENTLVLASLAQASNLAQLGFAPYPMPVAQAAWQTEYLDPRLTPSFLSAPGTNLWDGASLWLWRWPQPGAAGQGARYEPASGRWQLLPQPAAPALEAGRTWFMTCAGDLWVAGVQDGGWRAARYRRQQGAWDAPVSLPSLPWPATVGVLSLPEGPLIWAAAETAWGGVWFDARSNHWVAVATNGVPALDWATAQMAPLTNGWLALGQAAGSAQLYRYTLEPAGWQRLEAAGFTLPWSSSLRAVWSGADWYWLAPQAGRWQGLRYEAGSGQWRALPADSAPLFHEATQCLWNGRELCLVNLSVSGAGEACYSARYDPAVDQWRPMNPAAPVSVIGPVPQWVPLPEALLMVRVSDPSRYAMYDYAADRWQPLDGPNLGFAALVWWTGAEVLALPYQPPPEEPLWLHRFTPPRRVGWFYRPSP